MRKRRFEPKRLPKKKKGVPFIFTDSTDFNYKYNSPLFPNALLHPFLPAPNNPYMLHRCFVHDYPQQSKRKTAPLPPPRPFSLFHLRKSASNSKGSKSKEDASDRNNNRVLTSIRTRLSSGAGSGAGSLSRRCRCCCSRAAAAAAAAAR